MNDEDYKDDNIDNNIEEADSEDTKPTIIKTKPINSTTAYKNKDFKLEDGRLNTKKYTQKLPMIVSKNLDLLKSVEKFIRKQANGDILTLRGEIEDDEFEELVTVQELFDEIMECINAHHNKEPFELEKPVTKINRIRRIMMNYI